MDPWLLAHRHASAAGVELRPIESLEDGAAVGDVIEATWGGGQRLDAEVIRALAASGNVPWGAFAQGRLAGFVLGWAGVDTEGLHVHSHMLAALPDRRHRGLGYALKLAQRAQALDQGIHVVRWTFDPLVARNAWFNLGKLGAAIDRFGRDFYGAMTDELNVGERSDRFTVRWDLDREPGQRTGEGWQDAIAILARTGDADRPEPAASPQATGDVVAVEIPAEYAVLRGADAPLGRRWRDASADAFESCLAHGLRGVAFLRDRSAYVFAREAGDE